MTERKIGELDEHILTKLDENPLITEQAIARSAETSPQRIRYRLQRLLEHDVIWSFYTFLNPGALGYRFHRFLIKLDEPDEERRKDVVEHIQDFKYTVWAASLLGEYDLSVTMLAQSANEAIQQWEQLSSDIEQETDVATLPLLQFTMFNYRIFGTTDTENTFIYGAEQSPVELDGKDKRLLRSLRTEARMSNAELGRQIDLSRNAAKRRKQKLEDNGVIAGYKMFVNFTKINRETYKVILSYDNFQRKERLTRYLRQREAVLMIADLYGNKIELEVVPKHGRELQQILIELRKEFDALHSPQVYQVLEEHQLDPLPVLTE